MGRFEELRQRTGVRLAAFALALVAALGTGAALGAAAGPTPEDEAPPVTHGGHDPSGDPNRPEAP